MYNLIGILVMVGSLACGGIYTGYRLGNTYGPNARAYAGVVRELNTVNAEVKKFNAKQDAESELEAKMADQAFDEASAKLLKAGTCPATKEAANIINGGK